MAVLLLLGHITYAQALESQTDSDVLISSKSGQNQNKVQKPSSFKLLGVSQTDLGEDPEDFIEAQEEQLDIAPNNSTTAAASNVNKTQIADIMSSVISKYKGPNKEAD